MTKPVIDNTMGVEGALPRLHRALDKLCKVYNDDQARHAIPTIFLEFVSQEMSALVRELREEKRKNKEATA